jgi:hypothetical protein
MFSHPTVAHQNHESAAGALCRSEGDGLCADCGVEMTVCNVCSGIGYHRGGCPTMPESFDYARCTALTVALGARMDSSPEREVFAACNAVLYGSDAERAAARESLASHAVLIVQIEGRA